MMDDATRTTLQKVLDNWHHSENCNCPHENEVIHTLIARNGDEFHDLVEADIVHEDDCPYTQIAQLLGRGNRQHWQDGFWTPGSPLVDRLGE